MRLTYLSISKCRQSFAFFEIFCFSFLTVWLTIQNVRNSNALNQKEKEHFVPRTECNDSR